MTAKLWNALDRDRVECRLCAHGCVLGEGKMGLCAVRGNRRGSMHTLVGERVASMAMDPVEKKPLYHFQPGTRTFSFGTMGCNFACSFCQNHGISRVPADCGKVGGQRVNAEILVREAQRQNARSVSFTYNEPTVFFELMYETAGRALAHGLSTVMVTNGFQSPDCLVALYPRIQAVNVDLKSFREDFYRQRCKARLAPVLDNLKAMVAMDWWVEVTTLLIPGCNDSPEELRDMACFIRSELGPHVPWHLSRFHGAYQMQDHQATPLATLERAWMLGRSEGLHFVYTGNVGGGPATSTFCPACHTVCVTREGFSSHVLLEGNTCPQCGEIIAGQWS